MNQKKDYQLRWISENEAIYSENQIKAAREELKRRESVLANSDDIKNYFKHLWNTVYRLFK